MAIPTLPFGKLNSQSTRTLFGAAALSRVSQDDADRTLDVLLQYMVSIISMLRLVMVTPNCASPPG